ncbi:Transcriptional regulator, MarR family [Micrococcus lylae]|uniref:MarR family transcriptional regulator n=1 Tax=Micrococcus lylae TaxID=1273 RepID=A0A1R4JE39_9MICC|nr:MarR family transcriptional regulator [Micrococcus lylae]TFH99983.1 MarR family transcriptional regulator [Micrococcus lylae]SJN30286.1 Transcriptional regulator, MarR family [Micrococcus lylae]
MSSTPLPLGAAAEHPEEFEAAIRDLEGSFVTLVRQYRQLVARHAEQLSPGMSSGAMKAFLTIVNAAPLSPSALAETMLADRAQISRFVKELESLELITREADPKDRRAAVLRPTEEGLRRLHEVRTGPVGGGMRRDLAGWDLEDVRQLGTLLHRFTEERARRAE